MPTASPTIAGSAHQPLQPRVEPRIIDRVRARRRLLPTAMLKRCGLGAGTARLTRSAGRPQGGRGHTATRRRPGRSAVNCTKPRNTSVPGPRPSGADSGLSPAMSRERKARFARQLQPPSCHAAAHAGEGAADRPGLLRRRQPRRLHARHHQGDLAPRPGQPERPFERRADRGRGATDDVYADLLRTHRRSRRTPTSASSSTSSPAPAPAGSTPSSSPTPSPPARRSIR